LVNTHPDLAFAIGYVTCFLEEPQEDHLAVVKRILRYVADTSNWGLWFGWKKGNQALLIWFGDVDARKSTIWVIFFLENSLITWQSTKQRVVAQSSCESGYIVMVNATYQTLWIAHVLVKVQGSVLSMPLLRVGNKSTIALIMNPVLHR
jgi:hypothetical protein